MERDRGGTVQRAGTSNPFTTKGIYECLMENGGIMELVQDSLEPHIPA